MRILKFVLLFFVIFALVCVSLFAITYSLIPKIESPVSILILGKGGEGHTAPNLTDTIMIAHLNKNNKSINVLSLPRDIWIPEIRAKLNTAYHYGGFKMAGESVGSITGYTPDNFLVVDFSLFKDLIDIMGGIEVDVERSFTDEKYPIEGKENDLCDGDYTYACRYETLQFTKGLQYMDGETTLKFVRSRNAILEEGSDTAREKRQQKVVTAVKEKVLSKEVLFNYKVIKKIYDTVIFHLETDIDSQETLALAKFALAAKDNINFLSIPEDMITVSKDDKKYDRQYVFIPASGSWNEFQAWFKNQY